MAESESGKTDDGWRLWQAPSLRPLPKHVDPAIRGERKPANRSGFTTVTVVVDRQEPAGSPGGVLSPAVTKQWVPVGPW
jgi:hypothetical protein